MDSIARHVEGMLRLQRLGAVTSTTATSAPAAFKHGVAGLRFPGFVPAYIRRCSAKAAAVPLGGASGEPADIITDKLVLDHSQDKVLARWIPLAQQRVRFRACRRASAGWATAARRSAWR
jgi:urocanate hydratase